MNKKNIKEDAVNFIKRNKKLLIDTFASDEICPKQDAPFSIFMAGSPGAGKTEFCKNFIKAAKIKVVRIDADDIRDIIPSYTGKNSDKVQGAAALGVEKLYDYVLDKSKNCVLDGTFSKYEIASKNIDRSIRRGRGVLIFYVYQDPLVAWRFTKAREDLEGRRVPKGIFIDAFFNSKKNVNRIKELYKKDVKVFVIEKNTETNLYNFYPDIDQIDSFIKIPYTKTKLNKMI